MLQLPRPGLFQRAEKAGLSDQSLQMMSDYLLGPRISDSGGVVDLIALCLLQSFSHRLQRWINASHDAHPIALRCVASSLSRSHTHTASELDGPTPPQPMSVSHRQSPLTSSSVTSSSDEIQAKASSASIADSSPVELDFEGQEAPLTLGERFRDMFHDHQVVVNTFIAGEYLDSWLGLSALFQELFKSYELS